MEPDILKIIVLVPPVQRAAVVTVQERVPAYAGNAVNIDTTISDVIERYLNIKVCLVVAFDIDFINSDCCSIYCCVGCPIRHLHLRTHKYGISR